MQDQPLEVHGDGSQSRCFLHVADTVTAVIAILGCARAVGQVVNIGSAEEVDIRALAKRVVRLAGSASAVRSISYAEAFPEGGFEDMRRRVPDVSRLQNLTGWKQTRDLDETIRDFLTTARKDKAAVQLDRNNVINNSFRTVA